MCNTVNTHFRGERGGGREGGGSVECDNMLTKLTFQKYLCLCNG